jgi:diguanylate cyclase (GGDEF)-like protein
MTESLETAHPSIAPSAAMPILIADDSAVSRRLLEVVLGKWGYAVTTVDNGSQAWDVLQRHDAPRIAILDWMMPGYSGPEVCSLVRQQAKDYYTYILLLTSRNEREDLIAGMEAGADDYLVKPFDNNELKVRLGPGRRIVELQSELLKMQEALRVQATRDSLTNLWNRHAIFEILGRELARAHRDERPLGILIGDLDKFKNINDAYGHVAGDAVLREIASRMLSAVRPYDAVGRYGGEEFLIILPGCPGEAALQSAERLREAIQAAPVSVPSVGDLAVTVSFGVTSLLPGSHANPEPVVRLADQALYRAKQQGRNRSVLLPLG